MKYFVDIACIIALFAATACLKGAQDGVLLFESEDRGLRRITWRVSEAKLKEASYWDASNECPLSVSQAYKIAQKWFKENDGSGAKIITIELRRAGHNPIGDTGCWWYIVRASLPPHEMTTCVVLLSGDVVAPAKP